MTSVSQLGSGYQGRFLLSEAPVFIIRREAFCALSAPILEDAQPHTWALGGHVPQGPLFLEIDPHVSSLSDDTLPSFQFQG